MAKPKLERVVSPKGTAAYAWINKPDDKFGEDGADYKITVVLEDNTESRDFCKKIKKLGEAHAKEDGTKLKKGYRLPYKLPEDDDTDDEDFKEEFKGMIRIEGKTKYKPKQIDAKKQPLTEDIWVMSGDEVKVRFAVKSYPGFGTGVTCKLDMIQLLAKNAMGGTGSTDGFDEEEGYENEATSAPDDDEDF